MATKKKTRGRPKKVTEPDNTITKKTCAECGREKPIRNYFKSNNLLHIDGYMPMCKDCIRDLCYDEIDDDVDINKLKKLLQELDRPYIPYYYNKAVQEYEVKRIGKDVPKKDRLTIVGIYFKYIQGLTQIRCLRWKDSEDFEENYNVPVKKIFSDNAEFERGSYEDPKSDDFKVTEDIIRLFGEGYNIAEYKAMNDKYNFLAQNYPATTSMHIEALANYVRLKVKAERATARGNFNEAKSWDDLAQKAADKAKINPSQLTAKDLQGGLNSFSEVFQNVEQAVDIIPILPQFKYRPNDAPDFIIWCFVNYIRKLEGKPECSYEDIYHFYDDKKAEYIEQYGDPYGIFDNDPSEENRDKIKKFIDVPEE